MRQLPSLTPFLYTNRPIIRAASQTFRSKDNRHQSLRHREDALFADWLRVRDDFVPGYVIELIGGAFLGLWLVHRVAQRLFEAVIIVLTAISAVILFR